MRSAPQLLQQLRILRVARLGEVQWAPPQTCLLDSLHAQQQPADTSPLRGIMGCHQGSGKPPAGHPGVRGRHLAHLLLRVATVAAPDDHDVRSHRRVLLGGERKPGLPHPPMDLHLRWCADMQQASNRRSEGSSEPVAWQFVNKRTQTLQTSP